MPTLDLGCGGHKRGDIGIDAEKWPNVDHVLRLGFDAIPYDSNHFDGATMIHAIEHIPFTLWDHEGGRTYPMVQLLREVFRVLKPKALFHILTLEFPDPRCVEDPQHVSFWTRKTISHFVGQRDSIIGNENDRMAGFHVPFELVRSDLTSDGLLEIILRKPSA